MNETKQLILAVGLSVLVLFGFHAFFDKPATFIKDESSYNNSALTSSETKEEPVNKEPVVVREEALKKIKRIAINSDTLRGSIASKGAMIDDLVLKNYNESTAEDSKKIVLLNPKNTAQGCFVSSQWQKVGDNDMGNLPNDQTEWNIDNDVTELTPLQSVTLSWFNEKGIKFEKIIKLDNQYLFSITEKVTNFSPQELNIRPCTEILRASPPQSSGFFILHEGPVGVINRKLFEASYEDVQKNPITNLTTGGWCGFTDKYWLMALIPDQKTAVTSKYSWSNSGYSNQVIASTYAVKPNETISYSYHVFVGPKVLRILDGYEASYGFQRFDLAVDFGWFYFLTKPLFYFLEFINQMVHNLGIAILLLTVIFKLLMYPFANKSYKSMARMRNLQPKIEHIRQRYSDDKMRMNQEIMAFYKKEKLNPMGGCLPMLIQAPIFFCLYKVLFVTIEMRHAPLFGWVKDLSAADPTSLFNLFGLIPWDPPSFLQIGIWPILMGLTMVLQQRLNPQPADPAQAKVMMIMPLMFTYMFASFPVGLVIYWAWSNILSILQQWWIIKQNTQ